MKITTSHSITTMRFTYDEGDEKALTQTEVVLKEVISALQQADCSVMKSEYDSITLDELHEALHAIQKLLYEVPSVTEAW